MSKKSSWKIPFFNIKFLKKPKNFKNENSIRLKNTNFQIYEPMMGKSFLIYNGAKYKKVTIWKGVVSHKIGEFLETRKYVNHVKKKKIKALEKKNKEEKKKIKNINKKKLILTF